MSGSGLETVVSGGTVCLSEELCPVDLGLAGGRIAAIAPAGSLTGLREVEVAGRLVFPGAVDPHVHLEQLTASGQVSSDDFRQGSSAALWGGVTTLGDFAYPEGGERLAEAWERRGRAASQRCLTRWFLHQAFLGNDPDLDDQVEEVIELGARSFKLHLNDPRVDEEFLDRVCRLLARPECLLLVHAEQGERLRQNLDRLAREGRLGLEALPLSQPDCLEAEAIDRAASAAGRHGTRLYVVHLTSAAGLEAVRRGRTAGVEIAAETCPQYLLLTEDRYDQPDGYCATCTPPFRRDGDREALWRALASGEIQVAATDHCPFTRAQKDTWGGDITRLPFGMPGVETMVALIFSEGRRRGFSWERLSSLVSGAAAAIYDLDTRPGLAEGAPADLFIYDPDASWEIEATGLHMNCDCSPYRGFRADGRVETTFLGGRLWPDDFRE